MRELKKLVQYALLKELRNLLVDNGRSVYLVNYWF
jgi:hypothetical protein